MRTIECNTKKFTKHPEKYFDGAYDSFLEFGGPSVYFHNECLKECKENFLSKRHIELIYATLTAWGMHRMGQKGSKITEWEEFKKLFRKNQKLLECLRNQYLTMVNSKNDEYSKILKSLSDVFKSLKISTSNQNIVMNSKALFHVLPDLLPPIDRQYTVRFFTKRPDEWLNNKGSFRPISNLPSDVDRQFEIYSLICTKIKDLATNTNLGQYVEGERERNNVYPAKAIDNAIVNYIKIEKPDRTQSTAR